MKYVWLEFVTVATATVVAAAYTVCRHSSLHHFQIFRSVVGIFSEKFRMQFAMVSCTVREMEKTVRLAYAQNLIPRIQEPSERVANECAMKRRKRIRRRREKSNAILFIPAFLSSFGFMCSHLIRFYFLLL